MSSTADIRQGMQVYGGDDKLIGTIDGLSEKDIQVDGRYVFPRTAIVRVEQDRVYLPNPAAQYLSQLGAQEDHGATAR
jgi:hypothetical protein